MCSSDLRKAGEDTWGVAQRRQLDSAGQRTFSINPGRAGEYEFRPVVLTTPPIVGPAQTLRVDGIRVSDLPSPTRSEERRVGTHGRCRWGAGV